MRIHKIPAALDEVMQTWPEERLRKDYAEAVWKNKNTKAPKQYGQKNKLKKQQELKKNTTFYLYFLAKPPRNFQLVFLTLGTLFLGGGANEMQMLYGGLIGNLLTENLQQIRRGTIKP